MKVVITGGGGFLGQLLARRLLAGEGLTHPGGRTAAVSQLTLLDVAAPPSPATGMSDPRVKIVLGDLAQLAGTPDVISAETASVFHLAAVVSGEAEANFDLGMRVNLDGTRMLLDACRRLSVPPRFVFASSLAVFGGKGAEVIQDDTLPTPQGSYGIQKLASELLVADYSRKGYIDGRSIRLPNIVVRPGKPNKAASGFMSGIIREPLAGVEAVCPVPGETAVWLLSPKRAVDAFVRAHDLAATKWGSRFGLNLPGITATISELVEALRALAGEEVIQRIRWERDPAIERLVRTWPGRFAAKRGADLGFGHDADAAEIIRSYMDEYVR